MQAGLLGVLAAVLGIVASVGAVDDAMMAGLMIVMTFALVVRYPALLEMVTCGRTMGKMALGLRVMGTDGGPVRFRQLWSAHSQGSSTCTPPSTCWRWSPRYVPSRAAALTNWLVGKVMVRAPDAGVSAARMAVGWAQRFDLSAFPDDVALCAHQYLTRMHEVRPDVAARKAQAPRREHPGALRSHRLADLGLRRPSRPGT